jgi:hypothetical protein
MTLKTKQTNKQNQNSPKRLSTSNGALFSLLKASATPEIYKNIQ